MGKTFLWTKLEMFSLNNMFKEARSFFLSWIVLYKTRLNNRSERFKSEIS